MEEKTRVATKEEMTERWAQLKREVDKEEYRDNEWEAVKMTESDFRETHPASCASWALIMDKRLFAWRNSQQAPYE